MKPSLPLALLLLAAPALLAADVPTPAVTALSSPAPAAAPLSKTPLAWSTFMAQSEIDRVGDTLNAPPQKGTWDYTTGLYADALIRLTATTGNPTFEKSAETILGSFLAPDGKIATYEQRRIRARPSPAPGADASVTSSLPATPAPSAAAAINPAIPYSLDDVQSGVATLKLYDITHDERFHKAADILRQQLRNHPRIPEGGFWHKAMYPSQMWLDGLYMGEPFYAAYAVRFREPADFDDITRQFTLIAQHTYDPATGLYYHGWDEAKKQRWANPQTGLSASFWGRAIGWYAMALVDVIDTIPADNPNRPALIALFKQTAAGLIKWQDAKTGVWYQVVDQGPRDRNYLEASASSMFVYALAKGVNLGLLPRDTALPAIHAGYAGLIKQFISVTYTSTAKIVGPDGDPGGQSASLNHICRVAGLDSRRDGSFLYYTTREPIVSNDLKGVGPFITAGLEVQKLFPTDSFSQ